MRVIRNTDGAVMIIAVFMAMIAIGALYYVVGLGDAILAQERMQDAADAAAFSSAVIHARGMNVLALINIIMASLLAILVMLSIISSLFRAGAVILAGLAFFNFALLAPAAQLNSAANTVKTVAGKVEPPVKRAMAALHKLQRPLNKAIPVLASLNAAKLTRSSYGPVVTVGTTFPIMDGLPTVDGKFDRVCEEAGKLVGDLASLPLRAILDPLYGGDLIAGKLKSMAQTASTSYAKYYCGGGPKPSPPTFTKTVVLPPLHTDGKRECDTKGECTVYGNELRDVRLAYSAAEGTCSEGSAIVNARCERARKEARTQCTPKKLSGKGKIRWRDIKRVRHFRLVGSGTSKRVVEDAPTADAGTIHEEDSAAYVFPIMCPNDVQSPLTSAGVTSHWNLQGEEPLCASPVEIPSLLEFQQNFTRAIDRIIYEVTDVLSCTQERTQKLTASVEPMGGSMKKSTPREMCNCAAQGEQMFQVRSIVFGDPDRYTAGASKKILVATGGREVDSGTVQSIGDLGGRFAVAQAEYYFDGDESKPETWLWNLDWKARMRRFAFARKQWDCPEKKNNCPRGEGSSANSSKLEGNNAGRFSKIRKFLGGELDSIIVH